MAESNFLEEIRNWEHPLWYGNVQFERESHVVFLGESEGSLPPPQWLISGCRWSDKRFLVHVRKLHIPPSRWNQESNFYSPREESFPVPLKYIDVSRTTHTNLGCQGREAHRWLWEYRWGTRFVWFLDRFHSIFLLEEKPPDGLYVVRGETDKKSS